ncbi:MAG: sensor histidine kinase [Pseudomonadota bacterium]
MNALAKTVRTGEGSEPLVALVETIEALSAARAVEDVAAVIRGRARQISGADGVTFVLREGDLCHYLDEDAIGPLWKGHRFPMSSCISGWAMLNGQTAVIRDIYLDDRIPHDAYRPTFVKSLVMTPVRPADPIAAIGAYWSQVRDPSIEEVTALSVIARATATALENVSLLRSLEDGVQHRDRLIRELDHRVKNTLAAALAIANQTLGSAGSPQAFTEAFTGRLMALSRAHELMAREEWRTADLEEVLRQAVDYAAADRVSLAGPRVRLAPETAVSFLVVFHELAVNALRHGALSAPPGRVRIDWTLADGALSLAWRETGGPPIAPPRHRGFGLRLIERGLPRDVGGKAELAFDPEGLRYDLRAPLSERIIAG